MEIKIQIPDNCELVKNGDMYIVKEKKQGPPKSWEEFCEKFPVQNGESYIDYYNGSDPIIEVSKSLDEKRKNKFWFISREEGEAFLALMQLRQLRKAWVGDWERPNSRTHITAIVYDIDNKKVTVQSGSYWVNKTLSFPTPEMAKDFLNCFKDLCETAKILL